MIDIIPPISDHSCSVFESIVESVDKYTPTFSQTTGEPGSGKYYLLNSVSFQGSPSGKQSIFMRVDKLGTAASRAIGENGCDRFERFLNYEDGWDGEQANKLSLESVAILEFFIANYDEFSSEPSLFLTRKGNLKLAWETPSEQAVEVEFLPRAIKYYIEQTGEESSIALLNISELVDKLRAVHA